MLVGVVGKTNTGKSTFFKAATLAEVEIANYPFATIKPNHGVGYIRTRCPGRDFGVECTPKAGFCLGSERFVPVDMMDVAGLVPEAHKGKGLGNQFLDDLRQAHVLINIIDCSGSTSERGEPGSPGTYDPANDIKLLETELGMWYLGILNKSWAQFAKQTQFERKKIGAAVAKQFSGLNVTEKVADEAIRLLGLDPENAAKWSDEQLKDFAVELRKRTKPIIVAANKMDVNEAEKNIESLKEQFPEHIIVPCSAESELALREAAKKQLIKYVPGDKDFEIADAARLSGKQKTALEFIKKNVLEKFGSTGVQQTLNKAVFELLNYIAVYPVANPKLQDKDGNVMPDCFLVPQGTTALDFAFKVHTDLGKNFVRAVDVHTKKVMGKEQKLKNGDVVEIISSK